jgi:hypothetical protein
MDEADVKAPEESALQAANNRIRDAAKWLIASSAAVGAALLAGTQLSNIGKLEAGTRLFVAFIGAILGLAGVVLAIFVAVRLLLPVTVTLDELVEEWDQPKKRLKPAIKFFKKKRKYLQGFQTAAELQKARQVAIESLGKIEGGGIKGSANERERMRLEAVISDLDGRTEDVEAIAQTRTLEGQFSRALECFLLATIMAAGGIVAFAWASNPPAPKDPVVNLEGAKLVDADLRDADLMNAKLDHADLTGADLTGANLDKASTVDVVWKNTTCPDGKNSDAVGNTCKGHLSK